MISQKVTHYADNPKLTQATLEALKDWYDSGNKAVRQFSYWWSNGWGDVITGTSTLAVVGLANNLPVKRVETSNINEVNTTRVGRWMSPEEYQKMLETGRVQMSPDGNRAYVANPADINAFGRQASPGSVYVEFDVISSSIRPGGTDGWGIIPGPGSIFDKAGQNKGLPAIVEMPKATNISIEGSK